MLSGRMNTLFGVGLWVGYGDLGCSAVGCLADLFAPADCSDSKKRLLQLQYSGRRKPCDWHRWSRRKRSAKRNVPSKGSNFRPYKRN